VSHLWGEESVDEESLAILERHKLAASIDRDALMALRHSANRDVVGVLFEIITTASLVRKIAPALSAADAYAFIRGYVARCIHEDRGSDFFLSRYEACWTTASLLNGSWTGMDEEERVRWKDWLRELVGRCDNDERLAIETGFLEHLDKRAFAGMKARDFLPSGNAWPPGPR
jgi:hypothetical protein